MPAGQEEKTQDGYRDAFAAMHATFARKLAAGERINSIVPSLVFAAHPPSTALDDQLQKLVPNSKAHAGAEKTRALYVGTPFVYQYDWSPFASAAAKAHGALVGVGAEEQASAREEVSTPAERVARTQALSQVL